jgi:hypothetical protein
MGPEFTSQLNSALFNYCRKSRCGIAFVREFSSVGSVSLTIGSPRRPTIAWLKFMLSSTTHNPCQQRPLKWCLAGDNVDKCFCAWKTSKEIYTGLCEILSSHSIIPEFKIWSNGDLTLSLIWRDQKFGKCWSLKFCMRSFLLIKSHNSKQTVLLISIFPLV